MGLAGSSELGRFYCNTVSPERNMHSFRDIQIAAILAGFRMVVSIADAFSAPWQMIHSTRSHLYLLVEACPRPVTSCGFDPSLVP